MAIFPLSRATENASDNCVVCAGLSSSEHCIIKLRGVNLINCDFINFAYCLPFKACLFSSEELFCLINPKDGVGKINSTLNISMAQPQKD